MNWLLVVLCLIAVFLPLPFGGNIEWAIFGFELSVFILCCLYLLAGDSLNSKIRPKPEEKKIIPLIPWCLIIIFLMAGLLQIIPLPATVIQRLSPVGYNWRQTLVSSGLVEPSRLKWQTISLSPADSLYELAKYLAYGLFAWLLARAINTKKKATALTLTLIGAGVFQSLYGLSEHLVAAIGYLPG